MRSLAPEGDRSVRRLDLDRTSRGADRALFAVGLVVEARIQLHPRQEAVA